MRILEPEIADLRHRIDRDNLCSRFLRLLQAVQHARVIRSRILADDKDRVRLHEIRQLDAAFADPNHFLQCRATRFVAHVRAVGQIVCSKLTSEQLIEKRSLIARPAACVKGGRIGTRKCVELKCNQLKRIVPRDRLVMFASRQLDQRLGQTSLLPKPEVAASSQIIQRMLPKKFFG